MSKTKILLAGDTNRTREMVELAKDLQAQHDALVTCIPLGKAEASIMVPAITALIHGGYSWLHLDNGWSHSPTSVVLRIMAIVLGVEVDYSIGAEDESTPREIEAELEGFSKGMLSAHQFMESLEE